jgi:hypothetical protein
MRISGTSDLLKHESNDVIGSSLSCSIDKEQLFFLRLLPRFPNLNASNEREMVLTLDQKSVNRPEE